MSRALVLTTVHQADDPRIRERTIESLARDFDVTYASAGPGPSDATGFEWLELRGGRVRRWWQGLRLLSSNRFSVASVHDPELIPAILLVRLLRRRVVFDVHENVPAQMRHKTWVLRPLRPFMAGISHLLLRMVARFAAVTLAESGYATLFRREHPVFPNYAPAGMLPDAARDEGYLIYVGDVTEKRGALDMVEVAAVLEPRRPLLVVGRCPDMLARQMSLAAEAAGVDLSLTGNLPHLEAMGRMANASIGLSLLRSHPNEAGSMPTKVIEYLQMGIPVVASDLPGTAAAVEGLAAVALVPPGDTAAAAEAIARVVGQRGQSAAQAGAMRARMFWPDEEVRSFYRAVARP